MTACGRLGRQTSATKNETSAGLKITFVDMTYPSQRPELPSLSHHFLLLAFIECVFSAVCPGIAVLSRRVGGHSAVLSCSYWCS